MSSSNCCFLTCIQVSQETGKVVWYSHLLKNFLQFVVIHTVKCFSIISEAEVDVFLEFSCFLFDPTDVGNLISGSSAFSTSSLYIWKFLVHILLKPRLKDFEYYLASMWNEGNFVVVSTFFGITFLWDWNENWPFPGHKQNLVCPKTQGKEQWPPQETEPDLPLNVWVSPTEAQVSSGLWWGQGLWQHQS